MIRHKAWYLGLVSLLIYAVSAYFLIPLLWRHYEHHPAMKDAPKTSFTAEGIPADPLNVGLFGSQAELIHAMLAANWNPADKITFHSSAKIIESVLLDRSYPEAPVSNLYLWNRREDLAFEKKSERSPVSRHHVRFWKSEELGKDGRPLWLGAATFDHSVGISRFTGQLTHHIAADVDKERDQLIFDLRQAGKLGMIYEVTGLGITFNGRNGGGDWYYTDGEMQMGVLISENQPKAGVPLKLNPSSPIKVKHAL